MQTLSVRLSTDDLAWLASLDLPQAPTPSDKLRALIGQVRRQREGTTDYSAALAVQREQLQSPLARIAAHEHRAGRRSELIRLLGDWLPQSTATLIASADPDDGDGAGARRLEQQLADRSFQLATALLRLALARGRDWYDPGVVDRLLPPVLELAALLSTARETKNTQGAGHG